MKIKKFEDIIDILNDVNNILKETNLKMMELNKEVKSDCVYYVIHNVDSDNYICGCGEDILVNASRFRTSLEAYKHLDEIKNINYYQFTEFKVEKIKLKKEN